MDKISAKNLIKDTFNYPFNEEKFSKFSVNLFDQIKIDPLSNWQSNTTLPSYLKENILQYKIFGKIEYKNDEKIIIAMIKLKSGEVVEKSRHAQRNFAKWLIETKKSDACLVSFFAENYEDWRFSLVKIDYKREETKAGRIKVKQELTPLRRYSYLVGKNEPNHTAQNQLSPLLFDENKNPSIQKITEAFSVERVSKNFYEDYLKIFNKFEDYIKKKYKLNKQDLRMYTQILFNRLMLIRFLEKKGWLKFNNSKKYLYSLFLAGNYNNKSFYIGRLKPLFFKGLGQEGFQKHDSYGKVCFLNGGLFEETELDKKVYDLPNNIFEKIFNEDGLFYRYNFTVEESTPLEIEVSIDPEMLGKIFEELITGREKTGAYYTPREIVSFMCRECLTNYFDNKNIFEGQKIYKEKLEKYKNLLSKVKILDPACGSGAYLLGMINELINLYEIIYQKKLDTYDTEKQKYNLKLDIIQNNLYGVDIDEVAVQIARLRLWLTLIVDYNGKIPEPLPNLDLKIECGNSITSKNTSSSQPDIFFEHTIKEYEILKSKFQKTKKKDEKNKILNDINSLKEEIKNIIGVNVSEEKNFEWRVEFAEIFFGKDNNIGFDILITNPPYGIKISENIRKNFVNNEKLSKDSYAVFILRGLELLKENGTLCYIISDTWRTLKSFKPLRHRLMLWNIIHYIDLPSWIFNATVNTNILTITKNKLQQKIIAADLRSLNINDWISLKKYLNYIHDVKKQEVDERVAIYFLEKENLIKDSEQRFIIADPKLCFKLKNSNNLKFLQIAEAKQGLATGDNKFYVHQKKDVRGNYKIIDEKLILTANDIKNFSEDEKIKGVNKKKYNNRHFLTYDKGGESDIKGGWLPNYFVPTNYYIDWSQESVLRLKTATIADVKKYYGKIKEITLLDKNKIASRFQNSKYYFKNAITYSSTGIYSPTYRLSSNTIFSHKGCNIFIKDKKISLECLLGILNSSTIRFMAKSLINHGIDFQVDYLEQLILPNLNNKNKVEIENLVKKIITEQKKNKKYDYRLEQKKIDNIIYDLFNLDKEDIIEIDLWHRRRYPKYYRILED